MGSSRVFLALDLGEKRVGIAKSDELGMFAHALSYVEFVSEENFYEELKRLIEEFEPARVIVGYPLALTGERGIAAQKVEKKVEVFRERFPKMTFELWDERLTTKAAEMYLRASGKSQTKRRQRVDSLSAQILLQDYMDANKGD